MSNEGKDKRGVFELYTELLRSLTRPIVTIIFAAVIAQIVVEEIPAPDWIIGLLSAPILYWFGDRTFEKLKGR